MEAIVVVAIKPRFSVMNNAIAAVNAVIELAGLIAVSDITMYVIKHMNIDVGSTSSISDCVAVLNLIGRKEGTILTIMLVIKRAVMVVWLLSMAVP